MTNPITLEAWGLQNKVASPILAMNGNSAWAQRYAQELREVVVRYADRLPRNVQRHLGPSEIGHLCDRQLVGKMAGVSLGAGNSNHMHDPWASIVGTAIHAFLEEAFRWETGRLVEEVRKAKGQVEANDPAYRWFTEKRVTPDPGTLSPHPGTADLYDARSFTLSDHKGVALDTRIPTPDGWTTMGELKVGDQVLGADGKPCSVTRVYPVQYRDCYRVEFKGGAAVVTDDVQQWKVSRNKNCGMDSRTQEIVILNSQMMQYQLKAKNGQRHLRVRTVAADLPEANLAADPYVLGLWLGDGDRHGGQIGFGREDAAELFSYIRAAGYSTGKLLSVREDGFEKRTILGLNQQLQEIGCIIRAEDSSLARGEGYLGEKIIPAGYLRSSREQRLELLRGLMDSDGTHNKARNQCVFSTTEKALAYQVEELAASLGWKSYTCPHTYKGFGVEGIGYQVMFTPVGDSPFKLVRKAVLVRPKVVAGAEYRLVQEVTSVPSVATQCIDVDSSDHLYLVTEQFIPTHNCQSEGVRDKLRRHGPPHHYFMQMLLYAVGYMHEGFRVDRICLVSWPRTHSTMDDMYVWEHVITPDDIALVADLIDKTQIREQLAVFVASGEMNFWQIPATPSENDCQYCPFFRPDAAVNPNVKGCPGTAMKKTP